MSKHCVKNNMLKQHVKTTCQNNMSKQHVKPLCQNDMCKQHVKTTCQNIVSKQDVQTTCQNNVSTQHVKTTCKHMYRHVSKSTHVAAGPTLAAGSATTSRFRMRWWGRPTRGPNGLYSYGLNSYGLYSYLWPI